MIELLIVIVIIGILATIATTSYQNSIRKARRADAKGTLMELAQLMERNFTETLDYQVEASSGNAVSLGTNLGFAVSPNTGGTAYYDLTLPNVTTFTYTLTATPIAPQNKDTRCMNLSLTNTGVRTASTNNDAECWAR